MDKINFDDNNRNDKVNITKYIWLLTSKWYYIFGSLIISLIIGLLINRYSKPYYEARSSLIYEINKDILNNSIGAMGFMNRRSFTIDVQNEITKMKSYTLTRRTIDNLDFGITYIGVGRITENELYRSHEIEVIPTGNVIFGLPVIISIENEFEYKLEIEKLKIEKILRFNVPYKSDQFNFKVTLNSKNMTVKKYIIIFNDPNMLTNQYQNRVRIDIDKENNSKMNVSIRGYVPQKLVTYLNTFCEQFLQYSLEQKIEQAENSLNYIESQINVIEDSISSIEKRLIKYKVQRDVFDAGLENEIAFSNFRSSYRGVAEIEFKQRYYQYIKEYLESETDPRDLIKPSWVGIDDPMLTSLIDDITGLYREELDKAALLKKELPGTKIAGRKINEIRLLALDKVEGIMESNDEQLRWLDQDIRDAKTRLRNMPMSETDYLKIERTYNLYNNYFNFLLEKRAEGGIQKASTMPESRILDQARIDNIILLGPNKTKNLLIVLFFGLMFPVITILIIDFFNNKIQSKDDIITNTHIPILGLLGHNELKSSIPVFEDPRSKLTESFRRIRTDLRFYLHEKGENTILVTSAISGEGKTFITVNMAIITAMSQNRVLLIGMDLRRPTMHKVFNISNRKGLSSYLIGKDLIEDIIIPSNIANLDIVPSGPVPPNPVELIEGDRMKKFFKEIKGKYDYIFIDTPPLAIVTDAQILSDYASLCVFVLRHKYTHKDVFEFINNLYDNNKFKKMAIVINDLEPSRALGYSYSYGYGYNYGYGYGYKSKEGYYYYKSKLDDADDSDEEEKDDWSGS